jgi:hypothetical protein
VRVRRVRQPAQERRLAAVRRRTVRADPDGGRLKPSRGLVLEWKREGRHWEALVVWHDDAALKPVIKMDWLRTEQLIQVPVDPNWTGPGS